MACWRLPFSDMHRSVGGEGGGPADFGSYSYMAAERAAEFSCRDRRERAANSRPNMPTSELNILGTPLQLCTRQGRDPVTGWRRDGYASFDPSDGGCHIIAAELTLDFLLFSKSRGNPLYKPPLWIRLLCGFQGLEPGDRWALCVSRWLEAERAGKAPPILAKATSIQALRYVSKETLLKYAMDLEGHGLPEVAKVAKASAILREPVANEQRTLPVLRAAAPHRGRTSNQQTDSMHLEAHLRRASSLVP